MSQALNDQKGNGCNFVVQAYNILHAASASGHMKHCHSKPVVGCVIVGASHGVCPKGIVGQPEKNHN